jgi:hypothetical protein
MKYCSQGGLREKTKFDDDNNNRRYHHHYYITGNIVSALLIMNGREFLVRVAGAAGVNQRKAYRKYL